jgi:beta-lactamase class A
MLHHRLDALRREHGAEALAAAVYDWETGLAVSLHGSRVFHPASTMKVAVMMALFDAAAQGRFDLREPLHVRNRFLSKADGSAFRVSSSRDANSEVYERLGLTMRVERLAYHMIVTSSNLATNLLVDLVTPEAIAASLHTWGVRGVSVVRGVEDEAAYQKGISNRATAEGMVALLRLLVEGNAFSEEHRQQMRDILFDQAFKSGIPAGLPDQARVAHKTGEISTVQHDCGLVYLPGRKPYAIAVLTEWKADVTKGRSALVASVSKALYQTLTADADA